MRAARQQCDIAFAIGAAQGVRNFNLLLPVQMVRLGACRCLRILFGECFDDCMCKWGEAFDCGQRFADVLIEIMLQDALDRFIASHERELTVKNHHAG